MAQAVRLRQLIRLLLKLYPERFHEEYSGPLANIGFRTLSGSLNPGSCSLGAINRCLGQLQLAC